MNSPRTELVISQAGAELLRRPLAPGEYTIGRSSSCAIPLRLELVSREHARIIVAEDGAIAIEDTGSANGTFLASQRVEGKTSVSADDLVTIGPVTLRFHAIATAASDRSDRGRPLPPDPSESTRTARFTNGREIARGGMGAILEAEQTALRRTVAMKVMLPAAAMSERHRMRFIEEAQITGQLEHPNIVPVHELERGADGEIFYTMKLVQGVTLKKILQLLRDRVPSALAKYPLPVLLTVFQKVCDALAFAHSKGVIHRDLKPANIMIGYFGEVLVMDWGLAKVIGAPAHRSATATAVSARISSAREDHGLAFSTLDGAVLGTPHYMSPEQARGEIEKLDARSDIFALGAILYQIVTGELPFPGATAGEIIGRIQCGDIVHPRDVGQSRAEAGRARSSGTHLPANEVPASLAAVCMKALAHAPADRYATVEELQAEVSAFQGGFATRAERAGLWKQAKLLLARNKGVSIAAGGALALTIAFTSKLVAEGRRAESTLIELRSTAPTFAAQARVLMNEQRFDDALQKATFAATLAPASPEYACLKAHILAGLLRLPEAVRAYQQTVALAPSYPTAKTNLQLCRGILRARDGAREAIQGSDLVLLQNLAQREGRTAESRAFLQRLGKNSHAFKNVSALVKQHGVPDDRLTLNDDGTLHLRLEDFALADLSWLRGLALTSLNLRGCRINDLHLLEGMPLRALDLSWTQVRDVTALSKLPLEELHLGNSNVVDLSPLAGVRLRKLWLDGLQSADIRPLKGLPLEDLSLAGMQAVSSLEALRGMRLKFLHLKGTNVADLEPLRGMPLEYLDLADCPVVDLRPLEGAPLRDLDLHGTRVAEMSPLRGMKLARLRIAGTDVKDFTVLAGMPLELFWGNRHVKTLPWLDRERMRILALDQALDFENPDECALFGKLEALILPPRARNLAFLKRIASLKRIGFLTPDPVDADRIPSADEFWQNWAAPPPWLARLLQSGAAIDPQPWRGTQLFFLDYRDRPIKELPTLADAPIAGIDLNHTLLTDLKSLAGLKLRELHIHSTRIADLSPLRGMPLEELFIGVTPVHDLQPLRGMPLRRIHFDATSVRDISPLRDCPTLEEIVLPRGLTDLDSIRSLPSLKWISYDVDLAAWRPAQTAAQFWREYDAVKRSSSPQR